MKLPVMSSVPGFNSPPRFSSAALGESRCVTSTSGRLTPLFLIVLISAIAVSGDPIRNCAPYPVVACDAAVVGMENGIVFVSSSELAYVIDPELQHTPPGAAGLVQLRIVQILQKRAVDHRRIGVRQRPPVPVQLRRDRLRQPHSLVGRLCIAVDLRVPQPQPRDTRQRSA